MMGALERWSSNRWTFPLLSGVMLGGSFYLPWLIFNLIALVPLIYWLERHESESRWFRMRGALIGGLAAHAISTSFLFALTRFTWVAALLSPGLTLLLAMKLALIATVTSSLRRRTRLPWVWLLPIVWVSADWLLTFGDLRMPGDHLYHTMSAYPFLVQFADLTGPYGITAVVVIVNVWLFEALFHWPHRRGRRAAFGLLALSIVLLAYDGWAWNRERPVDATLRVGIVQPDIRMLAKWDADAGSEQWEKLVRLSRAAVEQGAELLVWPETAFPWPLYHWLDRPDTYTAPPVERLAAELGVTILFGVEYVRVRTRDDYDLYNAAMVATPTGLGESWIAKSYLVPFSEKLPFRSLLGRFFTSREGAWQWITGGFEEFETGRLLQVDGAAVGTLVCYEQLFADLSRMQQIAGAGWHAVITNDAWFARTPFQRYQADAVRLRAIETRRDFVRSANTGISAFVNARGEMFDATELYEEAVIVRDIAVRSGATVYGRTGDLVAWAAVLGLLVTIGVARYNGLAARRR